MKSLAVILPVLALLGCGGGREDQQASWVPNTEPPKVRYIGPASEFHYEPTVVSYIPRDLPVVRAAPPTAGTAAEEPVLTLEDESGAVRTSPMLEPVRGKGYPELKIVLTARATAETASPQRIAPTCRDAASCEFPLGKIRAVTLDRGDLVQLVPRSDGIAIVAREMDVDVPKSIDLIISVEGRIVGRKQVVLLPG